MRDKFAKSVNGEIIKLKKPTDYKGFKVVIGMYITIAVIFVLLLLSSVVATSVINNVGESKANSIMTNILLMAMPDEIETPDGAYKFYVEKNEDFDPKTDEPADVLNFYYVDGSNKKTILSDGIYVTPEGEEMLVTAGFLKVTLDKFVAFKNAIKTILIILIVVFLMSLVFLAYYIWLAKEENKEALGLADLRDYKTQKKKNKK